ncbi:MAG: YhcH/YjgK/YiaL family protein [Tannerella sp.]|jgi:YhcH/YjgK/YiaL family protein|nr:YhcH/YjgK/YiaL family protein [Tannerella sp.]
MILDLLKNTARYEGLHPRFKQAFDFLTSTDLAKLPLGKIELDGKNLYANVAEIDGKTPDAARMETHNDYIDIQVPVVGTETMGWIAGGNLKQTTEAYNPEKDITFYADRATNFIRVQASEFAVFFPEDGHQPGIAEGKIKKVIVKVRI